MDLFNEKFYSTPEQRMITIQKIMSDNTTVMPYGKWKGELVKDLYVNVNKVGYLLWMVETFVRKGASLPFPRSWCGCILTRAQQYGWVYDERTGKVFRR